MTPRPSTDPRAGAGSGPLTEPAPHRDKWPWRAALLVAVSWTAIALVFASQQLLYEPRPPFLAALVPQLISWWCWAAWTPVCWLLARRALRLDVPRRIALHLVAAPLIAAGCSALQGAARVVLHQFRTPHTLIEGITQLVVQYTAF